MATQSIKESFSKVKGKVYNFAHNVKTLPSRFKVELSGGRRAAFAAGIGAAGGLVLGGFSSFLHTAGVKYAAQTGDLGIPETATALFGLASAFMIAKQTRDYSARFESPVTRKVSFIAGAMGASMICLANSSVMDDVVESNLKIYRITPPAVAENITNMKTHLVGESWKATCPLVREAIAAQPDVQLGEVVCP